MNNWEIKPLLEAPIGVLQEAWYRCAYNYVAKSFEESEPSLTGKFGWLLPGSPWEGSLMRMIPLSASSGTAMAAIPFSTSALPGMITYAVVSGPNMIDIAIIAALIFNLLEEEIRRLLGQAADIGRTVLAAVASALEAIVEWIAEHLVALIVIIVVAGLIAVTAPIWIPAAVGGAAGAAIGLKVAFTAGVLIFVIDQFGSDDGTDTDHPPGTPDTLTLDFPGVSVQLPTRQAGAFLHVLQPFVASAFGELQSGLRRNRVSTS